MRIKIVQGLEILAEEHRDRLERLNFACLSSARHEIQQMFPNHVVSEDAGQVLLSVRDKSFHLATFRPVY
jgi:hypothetical protein